MIKYNTLEIDGDNLIVDFEVEDKSYYENTRIRGVKIDTPLTYGTEDPYYSHKFTHKEEEVTRYTNKIPISEAINDLLIITPYMHVILSSDVPCGADIIDMAAVYDKSILLDKGLGYLKELGDTCEISRGFIDFILKGYALDMAIDSCNYNTAIKYWKMLTMVKGINIKECGCNGKQQTS